MLIKAKTLKGYNLNGIDGEIGKVKEMYFDDKFWTIRYLVVTTGNWFTGKDVLISPYFIQSVDRDAELVHVDLTKQQIADSPSAESDKPVSRQYERTHINYYGTPVYWGGVSTWGMYPTAIRDRSLWNDEIDEANSWDPNLRSSKEVSGYNFQAVDGEIGYVHDFIINDDTWTIHYLVLDTSKWLPGEKILISTEWIERISWDNAKVYLDLSRETIKNVPEYDEDQVLSRDYETRLHQHYNRKGYWIGDPAYSDYSR
jgi:uncharacterized protein YrrD